MNLLRTVSLISAIAAIPFAASAQEFTRVGTLACDVSKGIGLFVVEKQTLTCAFTPVGGGAADNYTGSIDQFGVALGEVKEGHLIWAVLAASSGLQPGALAGAYTGAGANASLVVGAGANVLVGGGDRAFSLQPISVEGQKGINIAAGITTVTLKPAS